MIRCGFILMVVATLLSLPARAETNLAVQTKTNLAVQAKTNPAVRAKANTEETRAFEAVLHSFQDELWARAEKGWRDFTVKFPESSRLAEAVLYRARCLVELGNYPGAIQLLQDNLGQAGGRKDEYLFWIAESHFRASKYTAAAQAFEQVVKEHPESPRALEAVLGQASARGRQKHWDQVIAILQQPNGVFRSAPQTEDNHELLARGQLLLAEAYLSTRDYAAAKSALADARLEKLDTSLQWQKEYLLARTLLAFDQLPEALAASSNLLSSATLGGRQSLLAEAVLFQGRVLERLDQVDGSVAVYRQNLSTNVPPSAQRQTLLRLSDLLISRNRLAEARSAIEQFVALNPDPASTDLARLTLAELKLREYAQTNAVPTDAKVSAATNLLEQTIRSLDEVIQSTSDRSLRGRAYLNTGWAEWMRGNYAESGAAFEQAAQLLAPSESQATARFKWADARFRLGDFEGARTNYEAVIRTAPGIGGAAQNLVEPALYQALRAGLQLKRLDVTTEALARLLDSYPDGFLASTAVLLTGQELNNAGDPRAARELFESYLKQFPDSNLAPEIGLAIARTYEAEADWAGAIQYYQSSLEASTNASVRARAEYYRALDTALSGDHTNAFNYFTNFVATYATNELAPRAQWWIGDYYWRQGDYNNAELNYQYVFRNWPQSLLSYDARMMAGRAAMARLSLTDARNYFTNLTSDLNCPPDLKAKAMFAYGDFLMRLKSADTNDAMANYAEAVKVYTSIERNYPSNNLAVRARGMIGECYYQFAAQDANQYSNAFTAFQQVVESPWVDATSRSQAEVGLGKVLEKLALAQSGEARTNALRQALDHYLNVFYYKKNADDTGEPDVLWIKKAGMEAGRLAEFLQDWPQAVKLYERLQSMIPALKPLLENKILKAREQAARGEHLMATL